MYNATGQGTLMEPAYANVLYVACSIMFCLECRLPACRILPLKLSSSNIPQKEPFSHGTSSISVFEALRYFKDIEIFVFQA